MVAQEKQRRGTHFTNEYVRESYDEGLRRMERDYTSARWFSSPEARFDYEQTRRALERALPAGSLGRVLEIGPGDGTWTKLFAESTGELTLLDQSGEMLERAREQLGARPNISYVLSDIAAYELPSHRYDLIIGVRCFEYFEDKRFVLRKLIAALAPGGRLILVTKNPRYRSLKSKTAKLLHTAQIGKRELVRMLGACGFTVEAVYPATFRWKSSYALTRGLFRALHALSVYSRGKLTVPFLTDRATESYVYIARRKPAVVELYGLPGSGKTHLARSLDGRGGGVIRLAPARRGSALASFVFRNPRTVLFWLTELFLHGSLTLIRFRLAILFDTFEALGRAQRLRSGVAVLEEGVFQRAASVYETEKTPRELARLLAHAPMPDLLVIVDSDADGFARYEHPEHPRARRGHVYLERWKQMVLHNHESLLSAIEMLGVRSERFVKGSSVERLHARLIEL